LEFEVLLLEAELEVAQQAVMGLEPLKALQPVVELCFEMENPNHLESLHLYQ
jgi:hypothetical protein